MLDYKMPNHAGYMPVLYDPGILSFMPDHLYNSRIFCENT